jgi:hypothetical protein
MERLSTALLNSNLEKEALQNTLKEKDVELEHFNFSRADFQTRSDQQDAEIKRLSEGLEIGFWNDERNIANE